MKKLKLCLKQSPDHKTVVKAGNTSIGDGLTVIAGPCSVETEKQTVETAIGVKKLGATMLRGGAFKPRTSPYDFQGLGLEGLKILRKASKETGLPVVTEVIDPRDVSWVCEYADVLQVGTRNMQNFSLLVELGKAYRPVLLKRGMHSTISEWLQSAEYILSEGNPNVILCERGIRTFETYTRNTLDLSAVQAAHQLSHLPVIVDPSHSTGMLSMIEPMSLAAIAAGADGITVEVHFKPCEALCDKAQLLDVPQFGRMMARLKKVYECMVEVKKMPIAVPDGTVN